MQFSELIGKMRMEGVRDEMAASGIRPEPAWFLDPKTAFPADGYRSWARDAMGRWLRNGWRDLGCTAVFAQNDLAAMGAIDALRADGLSVPEDVSVIGFDGTELCDFYNPRIAAVQVPHFDIGALGMRLLLRQVNSGQREAGGTVVPGAFRMGESVRTL